MIMIFLGRKPRETRRQETRLVCNLTGTVIDWSFSSTITNPLLLLFVLCIRNFPVLFASFIILATETTNHAPISIFSYVSLRGVSQHSNTYSNPLLLNHSSFVAIVPPHISMPPQTVKGKVIYAKGCDLLYLIF